MMTLDDQLDYSIEQISLYPIIMRNKGTFKWQVLGQHFHKGTHLLSIFSELCIF